MADGRTYELDELIIRPGTYFNPQTEVLVIVDDSPELDAEIFDTEAAEWVLISDEVPVDEHARDVLLERFQARAQPLADHGDDEEPPEDEDELDPDPD